MAKGQSFTEMRASLEPLVRLLGPINSAMQTLEEMEGLDQLHAERTAQNEELLKDADKLEDDLAAIKKEIEDLRETRTKELEAIQEDFDSKHRDIVASHGEKVDAVVQDFEALKGKVATLRKQSDDLQTEVHQYKLTKTGLVREIDDLTEKLETRKKEMSEASGDKPSKKK